ncbi:MAG: radical SAM protein, partial [Deltaproteobacteria bacterium]|nr:radical SAM protein [Deltaproteobacteria bacterium]
MLMVSELLSLARQKGTSDLGGNESMRFGQAGSAPQVVVWNVCLQCNMTCPHCYAGSGDQKGSGELNTAEGMKLLEDLAAAGVKAVIFSGGEPLLRNDLETLIRQARSLGMGTHLSSNGTLIDGKTADMLASAGISYVGVSVDGSPGFNDEYRGFSGGFEKALQGLKNAKGAGMKTGLRLTLTRRNALEVGAMAE